MKWTTTKNNQIIKIKDIPVVDIQEFREEIIAQCKAHKRVIGFWGCDEKDKIKLYVVLADDAAHDLLVSSSYIAKGQTYSSITQKISAFHMFEREFYEDYGIEPVGHPWLKPVRHGISNYPFFKMEGDEVHEVAVGPIHAGIIEPGHFRFMCNGEKIYHLEIQLGYQHRNIEKLLVQNNSRFNSTLIESVAGDTVIGHVTAYAKAMETLSDCNTSQRAEIIRAIALELERIAVHIGDLSAISNDIAYLVGNAIFGATRTLVINTLLSICGSRFGRGLINTGGVYFDITEELTEKIIITLNKVRKDVERMSETMFTTPSVLSRLEKAGIVSRNSALEIGMVGLAARASGIPLDARVDHPWGWYKNIFLKKESISSCDVFARSYLRYVEIKQSINIVLELLDKLPTYKTDELLVSSKKTFNEDSMTVSIVEGWRGEIVHAVLTDEKGHIFRYKIKDPSFNNWYGLALAAKNNGISDFPVCNKSFNLSYCGNDL